MALSTRSNPITTSRRIALLLASTALVASPAAAVDVTIAAGTNSALSAQTTDRYIVDGTLQVSQSGSDIVSVDKYDPIYGAYAGSTTLGSPGTLSFSASGYFITATIGFVDGSGKIIGLLTTNNDDLYNFSNSLTGAALLGADCASAGISACVVAAGSTQDLLPTISSLNGGNSLCCGAVKFDAVVGVGVNSRIASLAGAGTVDVASGNLVIDNAADDFLGTISGTGGLEIAGGRQVLSGANSYSGGTYVTGGVAVANNTSAFGTGTVHMIDPTVNFAASGTYTNDFALEVASPASADPSVFQVDPGVNVTLSGIIATGTTPTTDPVQYVTIDGAGSVTLTNAANSWLGTTTINSGSTLIGASDTVSGGDIVDNGTLSYVQPLSGTVGQDISGSGQVNISGLGAGEVLTFSGTNSVDNGFHVVDGSAVALTGSNTAQRNVSLDGANAQVSIASSASLFSTNDVGVIGFGDGNLVDNQGSITGGTAFGVALYGGNSTLINGSASNASALVSGDIGGASSAGSSLAVQNYGMIIGRDYNGIDGGDLVVTNYAGGQIIGQGNASQNGSYGIIANGALTLDNAGQIAGRFTGARSTTAIDLTNSGLIGSGYLSGTTFSYSDGNDGVQALDGGTIDNLSGGQILGSISGIYTSGAALDVTNAGTINGANANGNGGYGIYANGAGLTLDNLAGGTVSGAYEGVHDNAGNGFAIANAGTITGGTAIVNQSNGGTIDNLAGGQITGTTGIFSNAAFTLTNDGAVSASNTGIQTSAGALIVNHAGASISGGSQAFQSTGGAATTITNAGDITGGVGSTGGGNLNITNDASGNIVRVAFGSAIDMSNGGRITLTNAGDIVGSGWGVVGRNSGDSITNSGRIASGTISGNTITVGGVNAIELQQGGAVTNLLGGQITGQSNGVTGGAIIVDNRAGALISGVGNAVNIGSNSSVTNAGTITGGSANGNVGVAVNANSSVTNLAGTITGARATEFFGANDVLTNSGAITSSATTASQGYGALFFRGGTVNNLAGGSITGSFRGVSIQGGAGTVTNAGTIRSSTDVALTLFNGGTVNNQAGGLIDGQYRGLTVSGAVGTITNAGTIRATVDNGVSLFSGGTVTNQTGGTITALGSGGWGIYTTGGPVNVTNAGLINADTGIVTNVNGAIVTNSGTINGTVDGVESYSATTQALTNSGTIFATNGSGVNAGGALTLDNSGTISGGNSGLFLYAGGTVTNSGSIVSRGVAGSNQDGVSAFGALNLTNSGSISAAVNAGVVAFDSLLTVNNQAGGTITGGANIYGFAINAKAGLDLTSGGTLGAGSGTTTAVLVDGTSTVNLLAGSTTNGNIVSTGSTTSALTVGGLLNGRYDATTGTAIDTVTLASTGSLGGALLGAGDDSFTTRGGAIAGAVNGGAGNDALTFDIVGTTSYDAGLFDAFETRSKIGAGTLTLTGTDVMTTDFAVIGGTLVLSGGAAINDGAALVTAAGTTTRLANANEQVRSISGAGAIDLGANALILGGNDTTAYSGVISGSGSLAKFGSGVLTLSGANSYTGLTQISGGILRLGAGNVVANASVVLVASGATFDLAGFSDTVGGLSGAGTVTLGAGRLTVDQAANTAFSGAITGTGGLTKLGVGTLDLSGVSTYTGATFVNGGILAVNGSLASAVTVNSGGKLGGNGSVAGVSILAGGILAPGNSIGHLTVNGPLSFAAGSIYQVETSPTAADSTSATGAITIGGGEVQVLATGTAYNPLTRYTILDTSSAVAGTFASVTSNLAFLTPGLEYNPQSVVLVLRRNDINFTSVANNPNQVATAGAVQSIGISPLYDAVLVQSAFGARQAYDALSGEVYASTQTEILGQRDRLQNAMASNRLRSDGMGLWLDAGKSWGVFDQSSSRGSAIASTDTNDLLGGFNWTRGPIAVTLAGGRVMDKIEIEDRSSKAKAKSWLFGGQLAYGADLGLHAVAGGNYASHKISTDRRIAFPGFADATSSSRNGDGYHLFGQIGYASQSAGITIEPFVGLARDHLKLNALLESGGLAALDVASASRNLTTAQLGLKLSAVADLGWARLTPRTSIAWQHVTGDTTGRMTAGFQSGGVDYAISGAALARNAAKIGLDFDFDLGAAKVIAGYNGTIGGSASEHTAKIAFQLRF